MEGSIGLGTKKESLALARRILKRETLNADEFGKALNAILTLADQCKPWAKKVEAAYARLSKRGQKAVRFWMQSFHTAQRNFEAALRFIPNRFDSEVALVELAFAMDAALATGRRELAGKLAKRLPRYIKDAEQPEMKAMLLDSLGEWLAREGKWDAAIVVWEEAAQRDITFSQNAVVNIVEIHAARGLQALQRGFQLVEKFNQNIDPAAETIVPGNDKLIQQGAVKRFRRLQKILEKVVPKERQTEVGIAK